ncbi:TetR/AcrR family transcriptional regulator [Dehalobacter sp. DCM]|uniref:TetR/AcrR family transcriptional regulator n=1 Tax=Dehalobacter sp. DCM TaxID=2907827 RepID=UPI003081F188|nr:TetR/AcrR family transcriptional regulator [Dehalobacter sp. DCM]
MLQDKVTVNRQVARTREWIFSALIQLLNKQAYDEISISQITDKAGVARQTFYRNYQNKDDIIIKYIDTIFDEFVTEIKIMQNAEDVSAVYTLFFQVLLRHKSELMAIKEASLDHLLFNVFWSYHRVFLQFFYVDNQETNQTFNEYFIKYQLGGIISIILEWLQNSMQSEPEELGMIIDKITQPFKHQVSYLPMLLHNIK